MVSEFEGRENEPPFEASVVFQFDDDAFRIAPARSPAQCDVTQLISRHHQ